LYLYYDIEIFRYVKKYSARKVNLKTE